MGFQPTRQLLILGDLTVIFGYPQDIEWSQLFFRKSQPIKEKNKNLSTIN